MKHDETCKLIPNIYFREKPRRTQSEHLHLPHIYLIYFLLSDWFYDSETLLGTQPRTYSRCLPKATRLCLCHASKVHANRMVLQIRNSKRDEHVQGMFGRLSDVSSQDITSEFIRAIGGNSLGL